jgi:hypothetical protein
LVLAVVAHSHPPNSTHRHPTDCVSLSTPPTPFLLSVCVSHPRLSFTHATHTTARTHTRSTGRQPDKNTWGGKWNASSDVAVFFSPSANFWFSSFPSLLLFFVHAFFTVINRWTNYFTPEKNKNKKFRILNLPPKNSDIFLKNKFTIH